MNKFLQRVYRRFIVALRFGEARQYAIFLLVWYFFISVQSILRLVNLCFVWVFVAADWQELARPNFATILALGFYSCLLYAAASILLLALAPGSYMLQGLQEYRARPSFGIIKQAKLQYRLWLQLPLRGILYLLEIALAIVWGALLYAFALAQNFNVSL